MRTHLVIHIRDRYVALRQFQLAVDAGADGVFFISHHNQDDLVVEIADAARSAQKGLKIGINLLSTEPAVAAKTAIDHHFDMIWADNMGVSSTGLNLIGLKLSRLAEKNPQTQFFASVAFKYRPEEDPAAAARHARRAGFIPTTSGAATGSPPTLEKIKLMAEASAGQLAVASGMTPENIASYAPHLSHALVATGVSMDNYQVDPAALALFLAKAKLN